LYNGYPYVAPQEYLDMYQLEDIELHPVLRRPAYQNLYIIVGFHFPNKSGRIPTGFF